MALERRWILVTAVPLVAGCGGSGFSGQIEVPPDRRMVISQDSGATVDLHLPADSPFNIHLSRSSQDQSAAGRASGQSAAAPSGEASAEATASAGGSASAEFTLGHRIDNRGKTAQAVTCEVAYGLKQELSASREPAPKTIASLNLRIVVLDLRNHIVAEVPLVQAISDGFRGASEMNERRSLTFEFEPEQTYDVLLVGKVDAATDAAQEASGSLKLTGVKMHIRTERVATRPAN